MRKTIVAVAIGAALSLSACSDNEQQGTANQAESEASTEQAQQQAAEQQNPFFEASSLQYQAPDFNAIEFAHFKPAFERGMEEHLAEIGEIASNSAQPTFENTIVAMEKAGAILGRVSSVFYNLSSSHSNDQIRELQAELAPKMAAHQDNIRLNPELFARIEALYEQRDAIELDAEEVRLVEEYYKDFVRAGARLTDAEKEQIREINEQLSSLTNEFRDGLMSLTQETVIFVEDEEQLAGLSDSRIKSLANAAESRDKEGQYAIVLTNTTRQSILAELENRELRERIWKASSERGTGNTETDQRPLVQQLVQLRADKAQLLGYNSWGDYVLETNMAGNPEAAKKMLTDLVPAVVSNVEKEAEAIQAAIDADGKDFELEPWDWFYYAEKVRAEKYAIDSDEVKKYFEFDRVLKDGVFYAMGELFGITFEERNDIPIYQEDVEVYEVFDVDGTSIGLFYADYFARDSKRGGAWMSSFRSQSELMEQKPVILNNMNITKAPEGEPTLLSFGEVSTMFHEMGHALHGMFSDVTYPSLAGTSVSRDYVEFPSTFQEDWMLNEKVIASFAKHHETGEQIPDELLSKVLDARNFNQGFDTLEYVSAALLDLEYHTVEAGTEIDDVEAFEKDALERNGVLVEAVPPRYRSTYFAHVFAGGYSAGYYAYMWSEVLAADAFKHMNNNGGLTLENGQAFRKEILSQGNSKDPMQQYIDWRGQEPTVEALLERRGLTDPAID
ncbi:M3 family metallopeptidase [Idiomarina seosinensis]|uniref:Dipeptidyl carboxypeptidase II n=1 Tax=Idiomarina seosinensis TaxID=281739 RepID=A0A432ZIW7_9GAMM|nr:M3 family metallopeptidase [Idiomarina seosinensis]RUO77916.1 dipeptidyl carboxypeptidase II [Idiomarina seosinensis]